MLTLNHLLPNYFKMSIKCERMCVQRKKVYFFAQNHIALYNDTYKSFDFCFCFRLKTMKKQNATTNEENWLEKYTTIL